MTQQTKSRALGTDFNLPILDINDVPIQSEGEDGAMETLRLGDVCVNALMATLSEGDTSADGVVKLKRFNLARKIKGRADEDYQAVVVNSKQKQMVLDMAAKVYSTLIYGRVYEALEGTIEIEGD